MTEMDWHGPALDYLNRLCAAEYAAQRRSHKGSVKRFRYCPTDYVNTLIGCLDRDDEEAFKATKMIQGRSSAAEV